MARGSLNMATIRQPMLHALHLAGKRNSALIYGLGLSRFDRHSSSVRIGCPRQTSFPPSTQRAHRIRHLRYVVLVRRLMIRGSMLCGLGDNPENEWRQDDAGVANPQETCLRFPQSTTQRSSWMEGARLSCIRTHPCANVILAPLGLSLRRAVLTAVHYNIDGTCHTHLYT